MKCPRSPLRLPPPRLVLLLLPLLPLPATVLANKLARIVSPSLAVECSPKKMNRFNLGDKLLRGGQTMVAFIIKSSIIDIGGGGGARKRV